MDIPFLPLSRVSPFLSAFSSQIPRATVRRVSTPENSARRIPRRCKDEERERERDPSREERSRRGKGTPSTARRREGIGGVARENISRKAENRNTSRAESSHVVVLVVIVIMTTITSSSSSSSSGIPAVLYVTSEIAGVSMSGSPLSLPLLPATLFSSHCHLSRVRAYEYSESVFRVRGSRYSVAKIGRYR